ncbi:MAG: VCBS repeat-containing protein [Sandaracinaceae bacterium]
MTHYTRTLLLPLLLAGCAEAGRDPTPDELDELYAVEDPRVDATLDPDAPFAPGQARDVEDADGVYAPPALDEDLGFANGVTMPGDIDGDGYADLLIFAMRHAPPDTVPCEGGCPAFDRLIVRVIYGRPGFASDGAIRPDATIVGWYINTLQAWVSAAGDVDGDGHPDVLISLSGGCQQGNVFVWYGGTRITGEHDVRDLGTGVIRERDGCTDFGNAVGVGDLDGDGRADFVIPAARTGRAYLFYGRAGRIDGRLDETAADAVLLGGEGGIGPAEPAGDVDGDGRADLLVSHDPDAAEWRLLLGGERLSGEVAIDELGTRIEGAMARGLGDLDGDGRDEIGVTRQALGLDGYVVGGRATWPDSIGVDDGGLRIERDAHLGDRIGATSLRPAGDMNGDGAPDLLYLDSEASTEGSPSGALYLFLGPHSLETPTLSFDTAAAFFGQLWRWSHENGGTTSDPDGAWRWAHRDGLATGTDLDGDGLDDLAVVARLGAPYGRVYVWRGRR